MEPVSPHDVALRLSGASLKVTPQRLTIYGELLERDDHPSPESLYQSVRDDLPKLSLATVYKTLDALEGAGLISQVSLPNEAKRYDANLEPHHHLVCTGCRKITDFTDEAFQTLEVQPTESGFRAHSVQVQVLGLCVLCQEASQTHKSDGEDNTSSTFNKTTEEKNG